MAQNKTTANNQDVEQFLNSLTDERKRKDSFTLLEIMRHATGLEPKMWGSNIIGFGSHHYKYESGREGDMMLIGFSPRKQNLTIYGMGSLVQQEGALTKLGKYTTGKGCLYLKNLDEVDQPTLKSLIKESFQHKAEDQADQEGP